MVRPYPRPDVLAALKTITEQMYLLQRRLLRADGLSTLEHTLLLGTVAETLVTVQQLIEQVARYLEQHDTPEAHR